jgi:hypothetical protein
MQVNKNQTTTLTNLVLWFIFILYIALLSYSITHHELWGDEIHSWNIAKASIGFFDLISNTKYEGHPPVWYIILWITSKFTHDPTSMLYVHFAIACAIIFIILFFSPFPLIIKSLIPFGYFFLFEYATLSRNYAIGILFAFCICIIMHKQFKGKIFTYYLLLFLLSNSHLLALLLATSFQIFFLLNLKGEKNLNRRLVNHALIGIAILLPSVHFIFPPSDSSLGIDFWLGRWKMEHLSAIYYSPVRAFAPIPVWSEYHFWDTNLVIGSEKLKLFPLWGRLFLAIAIFLLSLFILKGNKKAFSFFITYFFLAVLVSLIIPFSNARHVGFIYIAFLIALWFYNLYQPFDRIRLLLITLLLCVQVPGSVIALAKDFKYPFSNAYRINELLNEVPGDEKIVTDYWCLNALSAFTDKPYYCVDMQKEASYLLWNNELNAALKRTDRYSNGISDFMNQRSVNKVYMISIQRLDKLPQIDDHLLDLFDVKQIDKIEGAIEKGGNLYLYEIKPK